MKKVFFHQNEEHIEWNKSFIRPTQIFLGVSSPSFWWVQSCSQHMRMKRDAFCVYTERWERWSLHTDTIDLAWVLNTVFRYMRRVLVCAECLFIFILFLFLLLCLSLARYKVCYSTHFFLYISIALNRAEALGIASWMWMYRCTGVGTHIIEHRTPFSIWTFFISI